MDDDNTFAISKYPVLRVIRRNACASAVKPGTQYFAPYLCAAGLAPPATRRSAAQPQQPRAADTATHIDTGGNRPGTQAAASYVAEQKIQAGDPATSKPWTTFGEMKRIFTSLREQIGETDYLVELERYGWKTVNDIRSLDKAVECYHHLQFLAERAEEERKGGR